MENFEQFDEPKVKEKNIYLLHLDKARIAILSSIIVGIIAIAFLIGMRLTNKDNTVEKDLFVSDNIHSDSLTSPSDMNDLFESKPADNSVTANGLTPEMTDVEVKKAETDVLTADNINIVQPAADPSESVTVKSVSPKPAAKKQIQAVAVNTKKSTQNTAVKSTVKNSAKNVAVSSAVENKKAVSSAAAKEKILNGFSVQVASYDNYTKAKLECDVLKKQNFETYIKDAYVNGTNYYRVRIGPFTEKYEATSVLDRLQTDSKYLESYIIKE